MKKLDKDIILATVYKAWQDELEEKGLSHPIYDSGSKFYRDIVANLLWIQKGLCAYTEQFLCDHKELSPENWEVGRYLKVGFVFYGHIDHYDASLKKNKGWLWDNFFVVH